MRAEEGGRYGSIVAVPTAVRWWAGRSDPQRIELYTRWSFYGTLALFPVPAALLLGSASTARPPGAALFVVGSVAVTVLALLLARAGLAAHSQHGPPPIRLAAGAAALALATSAAGLAAFADGTGDNAALPWSLALSPTAVLTASATAWPARNLNLAGAGVAALTGAGLLTAGHAPAQALALALSIGAVAIAIALSFRFTAWVLDVVAEQERTREVRARLAVAEERLRFARDLHDIMGRNLSAIAIKGQLAAQLVRRGRPEAAEELADISRIAEESLREVRGVVGGYRSATLEGELAGARSVLRAAGVSCTVTGDEGAAGLPAPAQAALGWVVREAVTNVLRHSRATTCTITLCSGATTAELRVINDGTAAGPGGVAWGNGLTGLAERLAAAGGRLTTRSDDGCFVLTAALPVAVPA